MLLIRDLLLLLSQSFLLYSSQDHKLLLLVFIMILLSYKKFYGIFIVISFISLIVRIISQVPYDLSFLESFSQVEICLIFMYLFLSLIGRRKNIPYMMILPIIFLIISGKIYEYSFISNQNFVESIDYWFALTVFTYGTYFIIIECFKKLYFYSKIIFRKF